MSAIVSPVAKGLGFGRLMKPSAPQAPDAPPPSPIVDQGAIDRQIRDLARKRKGIAAAQLAGDVGAGTVTSPKLGGG